jgi:hypothetical protein
LARVPVEQNEKQLSSHRAAVCEDKEKRKVKAENETAIPF